MSVFDCNDPKARDEGLTAAQEAISAGGVIVLPTDTVYGIGADAFDPAAVQKLLDTKGRGRDMPPPVLVGDPAVLNALALDIPEAVTSLVQEFWPGPLTVICTAQPSLAWDLGETRGTVALRMPNHAVALELLQRTGPLAVSSANKSGSDAATSVTEAAVQLGAEVGVYLDAGKSPIAQASTIIDATVTPIEIVREGVLSKEEMEEKVGLVFDPVAEPGTEVEAEAEPGAETEAGAEPGAEGEAGAEPGAEGEAGAEPGAETEGESETAVEKTASEADLPVSRPTRDA